jgi:hypothetical protein
VKIAIDVTNIHIQPQWHTLVNEQFPKHAAQVFLHICQTQPLSLPPVRTGILKRHVQHVATEALSIVRGVSTTIMPAAPPGQPFRITVQVLVGKSLRALDKKPNGLVNPYLVLHVGSYTTVSKQFKFKTQSKTKVIHKRPNPEWNETFELDYTDQTEVLRITAYDRRFMRCDGEIGSTIIPLCDVLTSEHAGSNVPMLTRFTSAKVQILTRNKTAL